MTRTPVSPPEVAIRKPHVRSRTGLWLFAFSAAVGVMLVNVVDPYSGSTAASAATPFDATSRYGSAPVQSLAATGVTTATTVTRDAVSVKEKPTPTPTPVAAPVAAKAATKTSAAPAPAAGAPDPGTAQAIAYQMVHQRGWSDSEYSCLVSLWNRESGWNVYASNPSGAYGIPQALPGSKMSTAGPNWQSNPTTQITWGLGYITGRYSTPCGAWSHSQSTGWY